MTSPQRLDQFRAAAERRLGQQLGASPRPRGGALGRHLVGRFQPGGGHLGRVGPCPGVAKYETGQPRCMTPPKRPGHVAPHRQPAITTRSRTARRSNSEARSSANCSIVTVPSVTSLRPKPRRSGAITRSAPQVAAICATHIEWSKGNPWTSKSGDPCPHPPSPVQPINRKRLHGCRHLPSCHPRPLTLLAPSPRRAWRETPSTP